jgi:hypothetical protein
MKFYKLFLGSVFVVIACSANAQNDFYQEYKTILKSDSTDSQGLSMIGMYELGHKFVEIGHNHPRSNNLSPISNDIILTDAYAEMYKMIAKNKLIILNEGHDLPFTRAFLYHIIDTLIAHGYKHFFFETLAIDSLGNQYSGFTSKSGYFTNEVIGGEVIRKIFSHKRSIHHYENNYLHFDTVTINNTICFVDKKNKSKLITIEDSFLKKGIKEESGNGRDTKQALNIATIMNRNPNEKYFVFCGYAHGARSKWNIYNMGNTLRHILGEDSVITIDQFNLVECGKPQNEDSVYKKYCRNITIPRVPKYKNTNKYVTEFSNNPNPYDMEIAHPKTIYKNNRPTWYELNDEKHRYDVNKIVPSEFHSKDYLALVYYEEEYIKFGNNAVPADMIQILANRGEHDFVLRPDKKYYLVLIKDNKNIYEKELSNIK